MKRSAVLGVFLALFCFGCSDDEAPTQPPPPPPGTIVVSPSAASVFVHTSQDFVATSGDTADHSFTWRLRRDPNVSDTLDMGTVVSTGPKTATYTAPPRVELIGYAILLQAVSTRDTTVRGSAQIIVPPVMVGVVPNSVYNVPPATQAPFNILVGNTPNKGFTLAVNGIAGGNGVVGTFVATGVASATYSAPVSDTSSTYTLEARSTDDSRRFGQSIVRVRGGFALPGADSRDQWVPEWDPTGPRLAFVRGGPAWELVVYDFETQTERVLAPITWSGTTYDGRVSWSDDGSRILFSQQTSGRRSIGLIQANGTGRTTFAPQTSVDYVDACFLPQSTDSIYVTQHQGLSWSLRAYPLPSGALTSARVLYSPASTVELHSPDAAMLEGNRRPQIVFETVVDGDGTVRSMSDDNVGRIGVVYSSATARTEAPRWAFPIGDQHWVTFAHHQNDVLFRVGPSGFDLPLPCYNDYFPEASGDLKAMVGGPFAFQNAHAVTRRDASGHWRIWIVDFPPKPPIVIGGAEAARRGVSRAGALTRWK